MKNWILGALATCRFELTRSFSPQRIMASLGLAMFPPVMLWLVIMGATRSGDAVNVLSYVTFTIIFLVALVCLLSLLLWATPNVHGELEGKTWSFIAMRPGGRISSFLGKYVTAVLVSFSIAFLSLTFSVLVADRYGTLGIGAEPWKKWGILCGIFAIASFVYGAILSAIGTIFTKRAMVVGAGFLIGAETILSAVPAVVSRFTMSYHLRRLGELWLGWFLPDSQMEYEILFGKAGPVWFHLLCIGAVGVIALIVGMLVVVNREYAAGEEV